MSSGVKGKSVLVTGGSTGIGRAIAIQLASEGAKIFTFARDQNELNDAMEDIRAYDPGAMAIVADAAKPADVERVMKEFDKNFPTLDILVNNAAFAADGLADAKDEDWRYAIETGLSGYLAFAHAAAERMRPKKAGHIIIIGSMSADARGKDSSIYVAAKSGIQGFSKSFALEMAEFNVRVSLIEPGKTGTDMQGAPGPQRKAEAKDEMLMAEDVAECVSFVLSRPSRVNMADIKIVPRITG